MEEMEEVVQTEQQMDEKPISPMPDTGPEQNSTGGVRIDQEISTTGIPEQPDPATASATAAVPPDVRLQLDAEKKISTNVMSICLTSDGLVIRDEDKEENVRKLSGVYCEGVQYYDLNGIQYINNNGMAILIDLLKNLLEMGVEVHFVNVHDSIKKKIKDLGLEKIINYGETPAP